MTTLTLESLAIAPLSDLSDVSFFRQNAESSTDSAPVSVRAYANGVRRVVSSPGADVSVTFAFPFMTRDEFAALRALVGVPVLVRDQRQRRVFGVIASVNGSEFGPYDYVEAASFTVTSITFSEVV